MISKERVTRIKEENGNNNFTTKEMILVVMDSVEKHIAQSVDINNKQNEKLDELNDKIEGFIRVSYLEFKGILDINKQSIDKKTFFSVIGILVTFILAILGYVGLK